MTTTITKNKHLTVIGRISGKVILTLHFTLCNFMLGVLLDNKTSAEVSTKLIALKKLFADNGVKFGDVFSLILTDNGGEFSDVFTIEGDLHGSGETKLFFCDPFIFMPNTDTLMLLFSFFRV